MAALNVLPLATQNESSWQAPFLATNLFGHLVKAGVDRFGTTSIIMREGGCVCEGGIEGGRVRV